MEFRELVRKYDALVREYDAALERAFQGLGAVHHGDEVEQATQGIYADVKASYLRLHESWNDTVSAGSQLAKAKGDPPSDSDRAHLLVSVAVKRERDYQHAKYGGLPHELAAWLLIMEQELAEAKQAFFDGDHAHALMEILQVVAVGYAAMQDKGIVERPELRGMAALTAEHVRNVLDL